jgi:hypothetical protein
MYNENLKKKQKEMIDLLPGKNKILIDISSMYPEDILSAVDLVDNEIDTIVLLNFDVWRYFDFEDAIFNRKNKTIVITNLGYTSEKRTSKSYIISWPAFYFLRKVNQNFNVKEENLKFGFSCLNYKPALHRLLLGYELHKRGLIDKIIFTQSWSKDTKLGTGVLMEIESLVDFNEYTDILPICFAESDIPQDKDNWVNWSRNLAHPAYTDAYCNIVTETEVCEIPFNQNINLPIVTEKSYKPFITKQVPIFLAAKGHISYLKSLGFECMETLLPQNYDQFDMKDKISAVVAVVERGKEYIRDFYFSHTREIEHNAELVRSDKVEKIILQNIKDIINVNSQTNN